MTTFCLACEVWQNAATCWICGAPGTRDPRNHTARSWRNPATWQAREGWVDEP